MRNHTPRKRFGQNFLHDKNIIDKIIISINPKKHDRIVEIGPGQGAITDSLIAQCKQLDIIEIDKDLAKLLTQRYAQHSHINLHQADALKFDFSTFKKPFRVVGNLPYNISTSLLFRFANIHENIIDAHFMLQKEVVERICAQAGSKTYGRLSVVMQYFFKVEHLFNVAPNCFTPAPKVDSAIMRLRKQDKELKAKDQALFLNLCAASFAQRRKTLRNNLKNIINKDQISKLENEFDLSTRAENLSLEDFIHLSNRLTTYSEKDNL